MRNHSFEQIYLILPYRHIIDNLLGLIFSILTKQNIFHLKLKNGINVKFKANKFQVMLSLIGIITFSISCSEIKKNIIEFSFDGRNTFQINLEKMALEDENLIELLFLGIKDGVYFVTNSKEKIPNFNKIFYIKKINDKKIVEINNGPKFYLNSIYVGSIWETFIKKIHDVDNSKKMKDKIVFDVGANVGDTALFYANEGAKVYSFEPIKAHYDAMIQNISLNPDLSKNIIAVNAAMGKDETLKFFQDSEADISYSASFVYNHHGKNAKIVEVQGYSLDTIISKYEISKVDLLKMDCKGCEFFLSNNNLDKVSALKIEYGAYDNSHKLEDLIETLKSNGFNYAIYQHNQNYVKSMRNHATILAER